MNGSCSTTRRKSLERLPDAAQLETQWKSINWKKAEAEVNRLQARIAKATQEKKWNTVKRLQYLLTHSYYAKALAVRKVTTNKGKSTPGVDKEVWSTPSSKMRGALTLTDKRYKAKPLRRVYIEKKGKKAKRPLGIPCMYDRANADLSVRSQKDSVEAPLCSASTTRLKRFRELSGRPSKCVQ